MGRSGTGHAAKELGDNCCSHGSVEVKAKETPFPVKAATGMTGLPSACLLAPDWPRFCACSRQAGVQSVATGKTQPSAVCHSTLTDSG